MSEFGEPISPPEVEPEEKQEKEKDKVKVRVSLFFDGTLNNRINIDQRIEDENNPGSNKIYQRYKGGDNSYEGDYSNVAKMEKYIDDAPEYDVTLSSYTEGPGTEDKKGDHLRGYAFGTGSTGVEKKVEKGIKDGVSKITQKIKKSQIIELLTIDVFGFSRGAAGARFCIHELLESGKKPIKERIKSEGYDIKKTEVCFAGLYDTVSSHGIVYYNDVSDLKLRAVQRAKKVVQLAAAEEHRKKFSLTTISSAGYKGQQFFLPGVHSDIGGGYRDNGNEDMGIFYTTSKQQAEKEKSRLVASGWYHDAEIEIIEVPPMDIYMPSDYYIEVKRHGIKNSYSRIPLHVMADFAKKSGMLIKSKLVRIENVPSSLSTVQKKINQYIESTSKSKHEDWKHNEPWLKQLRHDYLHFSARLSLAHSPRIKNFKRIRGEYRG